MVGAAEAVGLAVAPPGGVVSVVVVAPREAAEGLVPVEASPSVAVGAVADVEV